MAGKEFCLDLLTTALEEFDILERAVTVGAIWVTQYDPETKRQNLESTGSKPVTQRSASSKINPKIMPTCLLNIKDIHYLRICYTK
jgi:hypothetical protein